MLYITNSRMPTEKAHGLQIAKTIEALEQADVSVTLFIPSRKNHITVGIEQFYNIKNRISRIIQVIDVARPLQHVSEFLYFPVQRLWFGVASFFYGLFWNGVIYSRDITISFLLSIFGKQVVYEDHQPKRRLRWLYAFFLRGIPQKVIVAQGLANLYRSMRVPDESFVTAPNGVDIGEFDDVEADSELWSRKFGIPAISPTVLYVGHLYRWKGVYTLLDAAKNIQAAVVLIGGTKEDYERVAQYVLDNGIANVHLHPFMTHQEVVMYMKSAHILVLPNTASEERSQKYTTPIKLFEYMASGVPITASDVPSFAPYLVDRQNALLFQPDNACDLARTVNELAQSPSLAEKLSQAARSLVAQFTWDSRARTICNFISSPYGSRI